MNSLALLSSTRRLPFKTLPSSFQRTQFSRFSFAVSLDGSRHFCNKKPEDRIVELLGAANTQKPLNNQTGGTNRNDGKKPIYRTPGGNQGNRNNKEGGDYFNKSQPPRDVKSNNPKGTNQAKEGPKTTNAQQSENKTQTPLKGKERFKLSPAEEKELKAESPLTDRMSLLEDDDELGSSAGDKQHRLMRLMRQQEKQKRQEELKMIKKDKEPKNTKGRKGSPREGGKGGKALGEEGTATPKVNAVDFMGRGGEGGQGGNLEEEVERHLTQMKRVNREVGKKYNDFIEKQKEKKGEYKQFMVKVFKQRQADKKARKAEGKVSPVKVPKVEMGLEQGLIPAPRPVHLAEGFGVYFPHILADAPQDHVNYPSIYNYARVLSQNPSWPYEIKERMMRKYVQVLVHEYDKTMAEESKKSFKDRHPMLQQRLTRLANRKLA